MDRNLDEQLVKDFPLLFADRSADMQTTCMCWGFPGNGWEPLLRKLASKLEPLVQEWIKSNGVGTCMCGHEWGEHNQRSHQCCGHMDRLSLFKIQRYGGYSPSKNKVKAFFQRVWWHNFWRFRHWLWRVSIWIAQHTPLYEAKYCNCTKYIVDHPRASQVKEKFGTLRFYMTTGSNEMYNLIDEAEKESAKTCEFCGKPGKLRSGGWLLTLCDECATKEGKPDYEKEEEEPYADDSTKEVHVIDLSFRNKVETSPGGDKKNS